MDIQSRKIRADWVAEVSRHGGMLYITIPKRVAEYNDICVGDKLQIHSDELKRVTMVAKD